MAKEIKESESKIQYLQMVQGQIDRMSTNSALFKGFAVMVVVALLALSMLEITKYTLIFAFASMVAFAIMDIYYLQLERKFRYLYEQIRLDKHKIDFDMKLTNEPLDVVQARAKFGDCLTSKSIWLFYLLMIFILIAIVFIKSFT